MKFKCDPKELSKALDIVGKALSDKNKIQGIDGILLKTNKNSLILKATSPEIYIEKKIKASVLIDGEAFIQSNDFKGLISRLTEVESIEIEKTGNEIKVFYGSNTGVYQCMEHTAFPSFDLGEIEEFLHIKEGELKDGIDKTAFCVSVEDQRTALKGLFLDIKKDQIYFVAIDGARVAIAKKQIVSDNLEKEVLIPGKLIDDVSKIMDKASNEDVKIGIKKNYIVIEFEETKILINVINEKYFDYKKFEVSNVQTTIIVKKKDLLESLNRVFPISQGILKNYISIEAKEENIKIATKSSVASIEENIECKIDGKEIIIGFNSKYLKESVDRINEDFLKIELSGSMSPIMICPLKGESFKYVLMPLKVPA